MRKILTRNQFLDTVRTQSYTKYTGIGKTNEAFANDVNWGDSWVGILISSLNRKIKTKRNLKKMDGVIKLIKEKFDELVDLCKIEVSPITEFFVATSYYLGELEDSINNKVKVSEIIIICNRLIQHITDDDFFTDKDYLLKPTNDFLDFLKSIESKNVADSDESKDDSIEEEEKDPQKALPAQDPYSDERLKKDSDQDLIKKYKKLQAIPQKSNTDNENIEKLKEKMLDRKERKYQEIIKVPEFKNEAEEINKKNDDITDSLISMGKLRQKKEAYLKAFQSWKQQNSGKEPDESVKKELKDKVLNESIIYNYFNFILENTESPENQKDKEDSSESQDDKGKNDIYEQIDAKYKEIFGEEDSGIRSQFLVGDTIKEGGKVTESFTLTNENQIIELVRLFMRAYRIHTPGRIPSGRTGGKVAGRVFDQYEYVGKGTEGTPDAPGPGPYRNIEIYQKFETAMFDIMADTKYTSTIFSDDAKFYFSKDKKSPIKLSEVTVEKLGSRGYNSEDYMKAAKPLGKILLRFIRNMIDNPQMYREGSIGKFLNEYFGIGGDMKESELQFKGFDDVDKNAEITGNQKDKMRAKFVKITDQEEYKSIKEKVRNEKDNKFLLKLKFKGEKKNTYLLYLGFFNKNYYFFKTQSNDILDKNGSSIDIEKLPFEKLNTIYIIESGYIEELKNRGNFNFKQSGNLKDKDSLDNFKFEDHEIDNGIPFIEEDIEILVGFEDEKPLSDITYGKQYNSIFEKKVKK